MPVKDAPDHTDAALLIQLYDLRRESTLRAARAALDAWHPTGAADLAAVADRAHPLNTAFRQVTTYWEMVYAFAKYGVLHPPLMLESASEGLQLYAKVAPWIAAYRERANPRAMANAEWLATQTDAGRYVFALYAQRVAAAR
jgi:hypothetical protein